MTGPDDEYLSPFAAPATVRPDPAAARFWQEGPFVADLTPPAHAPDGWKPYERYGRTLYETRTLTTPDADERAAVTIEAWRFPGRTPSTALVFAGVHGTEGIGVDVVNNLKQQLIKAAERGRRPLYTTVVIPELIAARRRLKGDVRYVDVGGRPVEPNRNFPAPGESYAVARQRGVSRPDKAELLGQDGRPLRGHRLADRMLAETRILIRLIEAENPVRAVSVHAKLVPGVRGAGPGIFVDPRYRPRQASEDIALAAAMVEDAMRSLGAAADRTVDLRSTSGQPLSHPFQGNFARDPKDPNASGLTVLYTSEEHPPGTSFGGWAPARGITTITAELPRWKDAPDIVRAKIVNVHENAILRVLLGGLRGPGQTQPHDETESEVGDVSDELERLCRQLEEGPATEADIAGVINLGRGIARLGRGIGAALSVGSAGAASPAADTTVAVPEFTVLARLAMPVPILDAAANAAAVQWNARHHPASSGVDPGHIRTDVTRYVDLTAVAAAIQRFNVANPAKAIDPGTPPVDAVLVEAIHQFQAKCFFERGQIDGMAGESTMDSLGLVNRTGMDSVNRRNTEAHKRLGDVDVKGETGGAFTADTWFDHMVNPSFLGWRFLTGGVPRGVHLSFMRRLRDAERALLKQPRFNGKTPVQLGGALGFDARSEEHKGARPVETGASMHTYGLGVDIKYTGNPWVKGPEFLATLKRSALLMSGVRIDHDTVQEFMHDLGADATLTTAALFDSLAQRDRDFRAYLALPANPAGLVAALRQRRADGTAGVFVKPDEIVEDAAQRWRSVIQSDCESMTAKASPFHTGTTRDPLLGFLNLDRDLVIALRDTACLAWGAVDIGPGKDGCGDMMHFDDRVCGVGAAIARRGGNYRPRTGHPCLSAR